VFHTRTQFYLFSEVAQNHFPYLFGFLPGEIVAFYNLFYIPGNLFGGCHRVPRKRQMHDQMRTIINASLPYTSGKHNQTFELCVGHSSQFTCAFAHQSSL
jgi:hypothetical protein